MQQILNKCVISVRDGSLTPDEATHTIRECAVLVGMQVNGSTTNIKNTLLLRGMAKTTTAFDIRHGLEGKFGPIESAAVATGEKGFGTRFLFLFRLYLCLNYSILT